MTQPERPEKELITYFIDKIKNQIPKAVIDHHAIERPGVASPPPPHPDQTMAFSRKGLFSAMRS